MKNRWWNHPQAHIPVSGMRSCVWLKSKLWLALSPLVLSDLHKTFSFSQKQHFTPGYCCNIEYPSEINLVLKSWGISLPHNWFSSDQIVWNFVQSMAVSLSCYVQNLKMIWQLKLILWINRILWNLSFGGFIDIATTPLSLWYHQTHLQCNLWVKLAKLPDLNLLWLSYWSRIMVNMPACILIDSAASWD